MKQFNYAYSWRNRFSIHWSFILVMIWFVIVNLLSDFKAGGWIWSGIMIVSLLVSIFIHDIAQAITGILFNIKVSRIIFLPIGAIPTISKKPTRKIYEQIMLASGPIANLAIAGFLMVFLHPYKAYWDEPQNIGVGYAGNFIFQLQFINLCLGCLNLLPVFPMDAGRMLDTFLDGRVSTTRAIKIVNRVSVVVACLLFLAGIIWMQYALLLVALFVIFTIPLGRHYHPLKQRENADAKHDLNHSI
jgi:Zn-dependent protease